MVMVFSDQMRSINATCTCIACCVRAQAILSSMRISALDLRSIHKQCSHKQPIPSTLCSQLGHCLAIVAMCKLNVSQDNIVALGGEIAKQTHADINTLDRQREGEGEKRDSLMLLLWCDQLTLAMALWVCCYPGLSDQ